MPLVWTWLKGWKRVISHQLMCWTESGYQVAHWQGHVEPDELGEMLNQLGRWY